MFNKKKKGEGRKKTGLPRSLDFFGASLLASYLPLEKRNGKVPARCFVYDVTFMNESNHVFSTITLWGISDQQLTMTGTNEERKTRREIEEETA